MDSMSWMFAKAGCSRSSALQEYMTAEYGVAGESIVCFGGEDWWYHHPHSKNHILKRLARQNRVLFVNSLSMGLPAVSNPDFFLKIRRKLKSHLRWLRRAPEGLHVMTPLNVPLYGSRWVRALNGALLLLQIRLAMRICGMRDPIVWAAIPSAADVTERMRPKLVLYQVSDKYDANEDSVLSRDIIRSLDQRLQRMAGAVLYSGRKLFEESSAPHRYFLEQAVDYDHFAHLPSRAAEEAAAIPHPVLGYFGAMDYVLDTQLIEEVARRRPEWHWILIGLKSNLTQIAAPTVHYLGAKPYAELPKYVAQFDVCVLPWCHDNVFVRYGSAIKVREYLATGKPIVMAPLYEYRDTPGVRTYHTVDEFIAAVEDALAHDTEDDHKIRQAAVRDSTWDARARELGELIAGLLRGERLESYSTAGQEQLEHRG
jgi:glycosyltransferase involved in cell wall biosynthesis